MLYRVFADAIVVLHLAFTAFVVVGGFLAIRWRRLAWVHIPAMLWGAAVEFTGWICPLTPLEQWLRGPDSYSGGFIEHYLMPLLYPEPLTRGMQVVLGVSVLVVNAVAYSLVVYTAWRRDG